MIHFGLAYQLQQKLDVEMFAIIDTPNKPKKMFKNQIWGNSEKKKLIFCCVPTSQTDVHSLNGSCTVLHRAAQFA